VLPAGYILGVGSLPITLVRGAPNGTEALQKRLRRGLQHSAIDGFQVCHRLAKHLLVKSVARCLGVGKPGIISGRQRINWPQAIETLELHLIYSYQNVLSIWELSRSHDFRDLVSRLTAGVFGFLLLSQ
jgi:hypothetical protein